MTADRCRALLALFQTDAFAARDLDLTFDVPMLQAQLRDMARALDAAASGGR